MRRRAVLAALPATLPGVAGAQQTRIWTIGTARMEADGTIVLDLVARDGGGTTGQGRFTYPPGHPDHAMILRHLDGLRPGEVKPVPPFP